MIYNKIDERMKEAKHPKHVELNKRLKNNN